MRDTGQTTHSSAPINSDAIDFDVAVIGAGPAGSAAAAALATRGWRVLLIERDQFPRHKVCGEFLSPEAQFTLRTLGLYDDLVAKEPKTLFDAAVVSRRGVHLQTALPAPAWGVSRFAMDATLALAAQRQGVTLWQQSTVVDVDCRGRFSELVIRRSRETQRVRVGTTIAAGGRGLSTKLLDEDVERRRRRLNLGVKAHFTDVQMPDRVEIYLFDGGYVGINPVESGVANVCLLASYAVLSAADRSPANLFDIIGRQNRAFGERLAGAHLLEETLCSVAAVDTGRPSRPWRGMACLGDVATMIPPLCGDGMAMALQSATLCVPHADSYLRGDIDLATWQRGYSADWHAAFDGRLRVGRALQAMLNSPMSELLVRTGRQVPRVADYFMRATRGELSPLSSSFSAPRRDG